MNDRNLIFLLSILIFCLLFVILYQLVFYKRRIYAKIKQISGKLEEISNIGSDEKLMVFTDSPIFKELAAQINRLLNDRQKIRADYKREQIASRKMLANISHDIKTPLTVILGYLEILRLSNDDEMLKKTEAKAKQVLNLINQFFTLAKLESGDTTLQVDKINISETCREQVLEFYEILIQKQFEVDVSIPETALFVYGDEEALQRIFYNLLSNVVRYGSDGKYLGIFLHENEKNVFIDVVDKGKGIDPDSAIHIFDRLYTMEDSRNREIQGNGLGLTIAKNLTERMGGTLTLSSIPNKITTFTIALTKYT